MCLCKGFFAKVFFNSQWKQWKPEVQTKDMIQWKMDVVLHQCFCNPLNPDECMQWNALGKLLSHIARQSVEMYQKNSIRMKHIEMKNKLTDSHHTKK